MSSRNEKVMSLEDKVRIIREYEVLDKRKDMKTFKMKYGKILMNKSRILAQYDDMKAKLAAVRDLVITEYGKPNYIAERHAFLQKIMFEWYRRAIVKIRKISVALICYKTNIAMRLLSITGLPFSETQITTLKRNCHQASLQRSSQFESTTLCISKIAQELLLKMGISEETALTMYGPKVFDVTEDDEYDMGYVRNTYMRNKCGKRKLTEVEEPSSKSPRTSNEKHVWGLEEKPTELVQCESEIEKEDTDTDGDPYSEADLWPYEPEVQADSQNEEEDFELYDVISVDDSTEDFDAATLTENIIPDSLLKKECETSIDNEIDSVVPSTVIKEEPDEGQYADYSIDAITITNVRERVEDWLIKKECESTDDEIDKPQECGTLDVARLTIKLESETLDGNMQNCDGMSTTTDFQDNVKQETEEGIHYRELNIDSDKEASVELFTDTREDSSGDFNAASATPSVSNARCVNNDQDVNRTLELLRRYLQQQQNCRALEALAKIKAAFPQPAEKSG